jgi:NAD(P)H-hydrate epimerase
LNQLFFIFYPIIFNLQEKMTLAVLTASEMKQVEIWTRENCGISEYEMISQAGQVVLNTAKSLHPTLARPTSRTWVFVCGKGHNGADGLQCALLASAQGYKVKVFQILSDKGYSTETGMLHSRFKKNKLKIQFIKSTAEIQFPENTALIIEGLLGAGITKEAEGLIADCIHKINLSSHPVLSIDIPSGLFTDSTETKLHVKPMATISLGSPKISSLFYPSSSAFGSIYFDSLCFPENKLRSQPLSADLFINEDAYAVYPKRPYDAHKYSTGKVLIIAGSKGMHGAAILAAHSALKTGAGMVKLAVPAGIHEAICQHTVEIISIPVGAQQSGKGRTPTSQNTEQAAFFTSGHIKELQPYIDWADAVLIGPGLGKKMQTISFLTRLIPGIQKHLIVDGDGLQFFDKEIFTKLKAPPSTLKHIIATPHAGEFSRMGGKYTYESPLKHMKNAKTTAGKYRVNILLKGPTSIYTSYNRKTTILTSGNAGLATAGTGDILAGIITALACHLDLKSAAGLGVHIHSESAEAARKKTGIMGMTATDVLDHIPVVLREIEHEKNH